MNSPVSAPIVVLEFEDVPADVRAARLLALRCALAVEGIAVDESSFDRQCTGPFMAGAVRLMFSHLGACADDTAVDLCVLRALREFRARVARGVSLAPGTPAFARNAAGCAGLGLVAGVPRPDVDAALSPATLADAFECILTTEDDARMAGTAGLFQRALTRTGRRGGLPLENPAALVASTNVIVAARTSAMHTVVVGPSSSVHAYRGDVHFDSLEGVHVSEVVRLVLVQEATT